MLDAEVLKNAAQIVSAFWHPVIISAYAFGFVFAAVGVYNFSKIGRKGYAFTALVIGALLLNLPTFLNIFSQSLLAVNSPTELTYQAPNSDYSAYITLGVKIVQFVGLIAVIRGLIMWKESANKDDSDLIYSGFTFFFGGILCLNILKVLEYLASWLGGDVAFILDNVIS